MPFVQPFKHRHLTQANKAKPLPQSEKKAANESRGGNAETQWYRQKRWRDLRAKKLKNSPFCEICAKAGRQTLAQMVDHIKPVTLGGEKYEWSNLQSACNPCHNSKSGTEGNNKRWNK